MMIYFLGLFRCYTYYVDSKSCYAQIHIYCVYWYALKLDVSRIVHSHLLCKLHSMLILGFLFKVKHYVEDFQRYFLFS